MEVTTNAITERRRAGVSRPKNKHPKTDMTPMVDLGFLLIAFFVMTTELDKPRVAPLNMPREDGPPTKLKESNALTVLLAGKNIAYYYAGNWNDAVRGNKIVSTNIYSNNGLRKVIIEKKQWLHDHSTDEGARGLMMLIKSSNETPYRNIIDILDEAMINDVTKYSLVKMDTAEVAWIKNRQ